MTANLLRVSTPPGTSVPAQCRIRDNGEPARELSSQKSVACSSTLVISGEKAYSPWREMSLTIDFRESSLFDEHRDPFDCRPGQATAPSCHSERSRGISYYS